MSADDTLLDLLQDARRKFGDGILAEPARLVPMLADRAPELRSQIRGLAAALLADPVARIGAAADPAAAMAQLAGEIAQREHIDAASAQTGVVVAMRFLSGQLAPVAGPAAAPLPAAGGPSEWVGLSKPVGGPGATPSATSGMADKMSAALGGAPGLTALAKNKWVIGAVAMAVAVYFYWESASPDPQPAPAPAPSPSPSPVGPARPGPVAGGGLPMLANPASGQVPTIQVRRLDAGNVLDFGVPGQSGTLLGRVVVARQGWDQGVIAISSPGAQQPESVSGVGAFQLVPVQGAAVRLLKPTWERDGLSIGGICVAFRQQGTEVQLSGSRFCILANGEQPCARMVGCADIQ